MRYLFSFFLLAGLLAGSVVEVSCTRQALTGISVDPVFRPLIPPDTRVLAGVDVDKLKSAAFYRRHESSLNFPLLDASSERIGLDPRRDVSDLMIAWIGERQLFMVRGRFTPGIVEQKLMALGAKRTSYRQYTLLGNDQNALVFVKNAVAIDGSVAALHAALDSKDQNGGRVPQELQEQLGALPKGDQIWAVSRGGLPFTDLPLRSDYESGLSNIVGYVRATSIAADLDTGVHLMAELTCVSREGAKRVGDGLRAGVALGRLTTKDDQQDLLQMYDAIQVDQDKDVVHVRANIPGELADKLLAYLPELRIGAAGPLKNR